MDCLSALIGQYVDIYYLPYYTSDTSKLEKLCINEINRVEYNKKLKKNVIYNVKMNIKLLEAIHYLNVFLYDKILIKTNNIVNIKNCKNNEILCDYVICLLDEDEIYYWSDKIMDDTDIFKWFLFEDYNLLKIYMIENIVNVYTYGLCKNSKQKYTGSYDSIFIHYDFDSIDFGCISNKSNLIFVDCNYGGNGGNVKRLWIDDISKDNDKQLIGIHKYVKILYKLYRNTNDNIYMNFRLNKDCRLYKPKFKTNLFGYIQNYNNTLIKQKIFKKHMRLNIKNIQIRIKWIKKLVYLCQINDIPIELTYIIFNYFN